MGQDLLKRRDDAEAAFCPIAARIVPDSSASSPAAPVLDYAPAPD